MPSRLSLRLHKAKALTRWRGLLIAPPPLGFQGLIGAASASGPVAARR
jgi:hypothetical protein